MAERSWYEGILRAVDEKDADTFASYLTDDASFVYGSNPAVEGNRPVRDFVEQFLGTMKGTRHTIHETLESGDTRILRGNVTYLLTDGREVPVEFCNVFHMSGDRIRRYMIYIDPSPLAPPAEA